MSEAVAGWIVIALGLYLGAGVLFAVSFVLTGAGRVDPAARDGSWGFRLLILPGSVLLWPWLALRWVRGAALPVEKNAHRRAAKADGP